VDGRAVPGLVSREGFLEEEVFDRPRLLTNSLNLVACAWYCGSCLIPLPWEVAIRRNMVQGQPGQRGGETLS
jgi:hypothetical protein